jgi:hypothetical protein
MGSEKEYPRQEVFALSLRIWHPTIDAEEIASAFPFDAKRICRAGEQRSTPTGKPLEGIYRDNFYVGDIVTRDEIGNTGFDTSLDSCIELALDRLASSEQFLARLKQAGARTEFFVGWTIRSNGGAELYPTLLARLAEAGITLSLDVYAKSSINEE